LQEGNCLELLKSMDFLRSAADYSAALYSFLAGDNLAWLFRWSGFEVSDEIIDRAVETLHNRQTAVP